MKKMIIIVCVLGALSLLIQFFTQALIKHHDVKYSIISGDNSYMINENFNVIDDEHVYSFRVSSANDKKVYSFDFTHNYNKQDSVIKSIKLYEYDNLSCLFPIYKKGYSSDLVCNYDGVQVSNSYLKQINDENFSKIVSKLKKQGYTSKTWNEETKPEDFNTYKIYKKNIPDDIVFTMWFYEGFYLIQKGEIEEKLYLDGDRYENDRSYLIDKYFVSFNTDYIGDKYVDYYIFNIVDGGKRHLDVDSNYQISKNIYFNGIYKNKLYFTDLDNKVQYSLEPAYEILKEVGNTKDGFKTVAAAGKKLKTIKANEFLEEKVYFDENISNSELEKLYGAKEIKKEGDFCYFFSENGNFYKVDLNYLEDPILLFNFESVSEWKVKNGNIMIVSDDMLYFYNDEVGLLPILQNSELKYNYKNICDFAEK